MFHVSVMCPLQIAALWGLPRMMTLLEARVGRMLEVSTATQIANLAYRRNAAQLLNQSIHFLASHLVCVQSTAALADVEPAVAELVRLHRCEWF